MQLQISHSDRTIFLPIMILKILLLNKDISENIHSMNGIHYLKNLIKIHDENARENHNLVMPLKRCLKSDILGTARQISRVETYIYRGALHG